MDSFIAQTAKDYDMSYEEVERIYNTHNKGEQFYNKLEEHIKQRSSLNEPPKKDFVQWITEDALPTTKSILEELKAINAKRDAAKVWLNNNNIPITDDAIKKHILIEEYNECKEDYIKTNSTIYFDRMREIEFLLDVK